jgi:hypothetical protein
MPENSTKGIWTRKDETFYYLETGQALTASNLDKLRNILVKRGLITYVFENPRRREATYKIMTLGEAKKAKYEVQVVFASAHVKRIMSQRKEEEQTNPWVKS